MDAKECIEQILDQAAQQLRDQSNPKMIRQMIDKSFGEVLDYSLATIPYPNAMKLLNGAMRELSDGQAQPQDLKADIDFYGQVERLTEQFVVDIRRVEMFNRQQKEMRAQVEKERKAATETFKDELEAKEK